MSRETGERPPRVGLMGGTFDPVHHGHLFAAEEARVQFGLERVVFVPCGQPPHKTRQDITPAEQRYLMVALATASNPVFEVSRAEIERPGPSYTIDTLRCYRDAVTRGAELFFITGADAILEILTWRDPDAILREARCVAVARPGFDLARLEAVLGPERAAQVEVLSTPALDISSTDLRRRVCEGRSVRYLTPESVVQYLGRHGLYSRHRDPSAGAGPADCAAR